jgi:2-polyprenyl-3-methyl-5-hydroxy-6-metoxy-1,4-benzoquinol methylase
MKKIIIFLKYFFGFPYYLKKMYESIQNVQNEIKKLIKYQENNNSNIRSERILHYKNVNAAIESFSKEINDKTIETNTALAKNDEILLDINSKYGRLSDLMISFDQELRKNDELLLDINSKYGRLSDLIISFDQELRKNGNLLINNDKALTDRAKHIEKDLWILKNDTNVMFSYITKGLSFRSRRYTERELVASPYDVRENHFLRYKFAVSKIIKDDKVLDISCGVGYGSALLSIESEAKDIVGVDVSEESIDFAKRVYHRHKNVFYIHGDGTVKSLFKPMQYDKIVSYETIEHVEDYRKFISNCYYWLKKDGVFIGSVPNEDILPFNQDEHIFHIRHFTRKEIEELLMEAGFSIDFLEYGDWTKVPTSTPSYTHIFIATKK